MKFERMTTARVQYRTVGGTCTHRRTRVRTPGPGRLWRARPSGKLELVVGAASAAPFRMVNQISRASTATAARNAPAEQPQRAVKDRLAVHLDPHVHRRAIEPIRQVLLPGQDVAARACPADRCRGRARCARESGSAGGARNATISIPSSRRSGACRGVSAEAPTCCSNTWWPFCGPSVVP